ncbi:hypothetical protein SLEP1_g27963 [Rubroshorea leprosula]|uniref:EF-hand domain-containing protein n=1 Tax=Rubroshorea leprosula TaxID=152421 RepID=A0AAV5K1E8_9ROSI|nr:hypothetical protein SLEP1_g27963 [Rubroshorea leprosula]
MLASFNFVDFIGLYFVRIEIDDEELARFAEHVDKDNNGIITFEEWRDFLLLYPHEATIEVLRTFIITGKEFALKILENMLLFQKASANTFSEVNILLLVE